MNSGLVGRRQFVKGLGSVGALAAAAEGTLHADAVTSPMPWPRLAGSPVLDSLHPVIEHSRDVHTHVDRLRDVAGRSEERRVGKECRL